MQTRRLLVFREVHIMESNTDHRHLLKATLSHALAMLALVRSVHVLELFTNVHSN